MPSGPLGGPRPFAEGELIYRERYTVDAAIGERLESDKVSSAAEKRIAQNVERVGFRDPNVEISPAGFSILVDIGLGDGSILPTGSRENGFGELQDAVEEAVKAEIDSAASKGAVEGPEWEIMTN